jgi:hypothetical protein
MKKELKNKLKEIVEYSKGIPQSSKIIQKVF